MQQKKKTYFNWSSGKDSSLALYHLQQNPQLQIDRLITTINSHYQRVSMHGLKRELLEVQAEAMGIPVDMIELPAQPTMETYDEIVEKKIGRLVAEGYTDCGFGDIFLEDLRAYREEQLKPFDLSWHFPIWKRDTKALIKEFLDLGFKAIIVCTKDELLGNTFAGRDIDENFIEDLPKSVDPCGENGEFHTFCYDGPIFQHPVKFTLGDKVYREYKNPDKDGKDVGFWFQDLDLVE